MTVGKSSSATLFLFFLVVVDVITAASSTTLSTLDAASAPKQSPNVTSGSPLASPSNSTSAAATSGADKGFPTPSKDAASVTPPTGKGKKEISKEDKVKEKDETKADESTLGSNGTCDGVERSCRDSKSLVACITSADDASKTLVLLVQNEGDISLKVILTSPTSNQQEREIAKHQSQQINISLNSVWSSVVTLNAGNGDCTLQLGSPRSEGNFFKWLPPYSKLLTPIYAAYVLLLITLIAAGVWACCKFRKRKRHNEIPYQELEMGLPESSINDGTAVGWDQVWDDDWDDDKAVRSPGARHNGNISASGLTSRSANRDGWEEWDD